MTASLLTPPPLSLVFFYSGIAGRTVLWNQGLVPTLVCVVFVGEGWWLGPVRWPGGLRRLIPLFFLFFLMKLADKSYVGSKVTPNPRVRFLVGEGWLGPVCRPGGLRRLISLTLFFCFSSKASKQFGGVHGLSPTSDCVF